MIIAVDGPAGSGKGTLARRLAAHFGLPHLDTGLLYRATALELLHVGGHPEDDTLAVQAAKHLDLGMLDDPRLRHGEVAQVASKVAAIPEVRAALLDLQRKFAHQDGGAVLDGRDIGTVVAPDAEAKLFVTATVDERARRRTIELQDLGQDATYDAVLQDLKDRDRRDSERTVAPLGAAADAVVLDTSHLDINAAVAHAIRIVTSRVERPSR